MDWHQTLYLGNTYQKLIKKEVLFILVANLGQRRIWRNFWV